MRTDHRLPLIETRFAYEVDWQPRRPWTPNRLFWALILPAAVVGATVTIAVILEMFL